MKTALIVKMWKVWTQETFHKQVEYDRPGVAAEQGNHKFHYFQSLRLGEYSIMRQRLINLAN